MGRLRRLQFSIWLLPVVGLVVEQERIGRPAVAAVQVVI